MVKDNLIIDIGMHLGQDTAFYLEKGFDVIAVDADPNLIQSAHDKYHDFVKNHQLTLLNFAISEKDDEEVNFYVGKIQNGVL